MVNNEVAAYELMEYAVTGHYLPYHGLEEAEANLLVLQWYVLMIINMKQQPTKTRLMSFFLALDSSQLCRYSELTLGCGIQQIKLRQSLRECQHSEQAREQSTQMTSKFASQVEVCESGDCDAALAALDQTRPPFLHIFERVAILRAIPLARQVLLLQLMPNCMREEFVAELQGEYFQQTQIILERWDPQMVSLIPHGCTLSLRNVLENSPSWWCHDRLFSALHEFKMKSCFKRRSNEQKHEEITFQPFFSGNWLVGCDDISPKHDDWLMAPQHYGLTLIVQKSGNCQCLLDTTFRNPRIRLVCHLRRQFSDSEEEICESSTSWQHIGKNNLNPEWSEYLHVMGTQIADPDALFMLELTMEMEELAGPRKVVGSLKLALCHGSKKSTRDLSRSTWHRHWKMLKLPETDITHIPVEHAVRPSIEFELVIQAGSLPSQKAVHPASDLMDRYICDHACTLVLPFCTAGLVALISSRLLRLQGSNMMLEDLTPCHFQMPGINKPNVFMFTNDENGRRWTYKRTTGKVTFDSYVTKVSYMLSCVCSGRRMHYFFRAVFATVCCHTTCCNRQKECACALSS